MPLTANELNIIKVQLEVEQEVLHRYNEYTTVCPNVELKKICEKIASRHKSHYNNLLKLLS